MAAYVLLEVRPCWADEERVHRRGFIRASLVGLGGATSFCVVLPAAGAVTEGPYGSLSGRDPDEHGLVLPRGFTARVIAVAGEPVADSGYIWPIFPDGAAVFDDGAGGWIYVANSEVFVPSLGGVSAIRFDGSGTVVDAYSILEGSTANCGGGPTPWGTFLSGEEAREPGGVMWECDPTGQAPARSLPSMGVFRHEAAAVDPKREVVYLTEDVEDGNLYRYTPSKYPSLAEGFLEAATIDGTGAVRWLAIADPLATEVATRYQAPEATVFAGGEGIWYHDDVVFFTTKHDNKIHSIDLLENIHTVIYAADPKMVADGTATLSGVDNLSVDTPTGDVFVAEDGGNMEIVILTPAGEVAPFLRILGQEDSEVTGPVFNPTGDRLYFSSQRGPSSRSVNDIQPELSTLTNTAGLTYEVIGPFRNRTSVEPSDTVQRSPNPTTTILVATDASNSSGGPTRNAPLMAGAALLAAGAGVAALRRRGSELHGT